ncbi:MAG TPA: pyridoxal-phosphate dependent enzyme, partial [Terriglobia bacterium]|nr:pyridoxal-phosphate dependent enzyme [Terriglobia bacterium]
MSFVKGLRCRECGREYPAKLQAGCEDCFAPLEVDYHYDAIAKVLTRESFVNRPNSIWRYRELLPTESDPVVGMGTGGTPLVRADRLGRKLGLDNLYLKNDSVSFPTLSFKDRVTSM